MDNRKNYYIVLDTETCNTYRDENNKLVTSDALVYDIGFTAIDKKGNIYEKFSFIVNEIFFGEADKMKSAYYANKIPQYIEKLTNDEISAMNFLDIQKIFNQTCAKYDIKAVVIYNARFDVLALNNTLFYLTEGGCGFFFPYGLPIFDALAMARATLVKSPTYKYLANENEWLTTNGRVSATAENVYKYITGNYEFVESHTALEDALIEGEIFVRCLRQRKKDNRLWGAKK